MRKNVVWFSSVSIYHSQVIPGGKGSGKFGVEMKPDFVLDNDQPHFVSK